MNILFQKEDRTVNDVPNLAGESVKATCGSDACEQEYRDLRLSLKRVWELETEEEIMKLKNKHYPAIMSERQKQAGGNLDQRIEARRKWTLPSAAFVAERGPTTKQLWSR